MKKLYRKGVVHPTPPLVSDHLLYLLPATLLTLTAALSPEEREVLAYLISCSSSNNHHKTKKTTAGKVAAADHPACFDCYCFRCYTSYWVKWDSSPNRQLIHEIIDDFEDGLLNESKKAKKEKKRNKVKGKICKGEVSVELDEVKKSEVGLTQVGTGLGESNSVAVVGGEAVDVEDNGEEGELEKGSIRRFVSFVGEKIWGV